MSDSTGHRALLVALNRWANAFQRFRRFSPTGDPIDGPLTGDDHFGPPEADPFGLCALAQATAALDLAWLGEPPPELPSADQAAVVRTADRGRRHLAAILANLEASGSFIGVKANDIEMVIGPMARLVDVLLTVTRDLFGEGVTAFALNLAAFTALRSLPTYFVSLEMGRAELGQRLAFAATGLRGGMLRGLPLAVFDGAARPAGRGPRRRRPDEPASPWAGPAGGGLPATRAADRPAGLAAGWGWRSNACSAASD